MASDEAEPGTPIGLIAGQGVLPLLVADGMRRAGRRVCCVGLADQYRKDLPARCDAFRQVGLLRLGQWRRTLRRMGVREAVMVGRVSKRSMHDPRLILRYIPDLRTALIWYRQLRHDRRSPAVLKAIADELQRGGITLIDSTTHIPEHMATPGVMTRARPSAELQADIDFGWPILLESARLGIGQAIAVRNRDVIAVEAVEGTDEMIRRAGPLCRNRPWALLKTAEPNHDRRSDVPTIGESTVRLMAEHGGGVIAVGAGEVIVLDRPATIDLADELGVTIAGVGPDAPPTGTTT